MTYLLSRHPALLALLGAVLLWAAWPVRGFAPLLFIGFVPLLAIEHRTAAPDAATGKPQPFFRWAYLFLVLWNALTTWWVSLSTIPGGIAAVVLNALLMTLPLLAFRRTKRALGPGWGYASFLIYWVAFEQIHLSWDLTWPWLTLGNGFAAWPTWVQWYEYTGHLGGSVWVLAINVLLWLSLAPGPAAKGARTNVRLAALAALGLPLLWSGWLLARFQEKGPAAEVVMVQPNIDAYEEKFPSGSRFIPYEAQLARLIQLSEEKVTPATRFVLWPETALEKGVEETQIEADWRVQQVRAFLGRHPGLQLITGITTFVLYPNRAAAPATARGGDGGVFYDVCNTALHVPGASLQAGGPTNQYHKSKLVPGVEKLPYPGIFGALSIFAIDLGGTVGSYGIQDRRTVFAYDGSAANPKVAPVICYESIYGDFVADYVRQGGATLIGIITNDDWWGHTPGHRQHLAYAALRAIETRRAVVRAANTGISAVLDQRGRILQTLPWHTAGALRATVQLNQEQTFFLAYGDFIGHSAPWLGLGLLLLTIGAGWRQKRRQAS